MSEENQAVTTQEPERQQIMLSKRGLQMVTFDDMQRFATAVSKSSFAPKGMQDVATIVVALQMGAELGMPPMMALQSIAVINGRPSLFGDALPGIVRASGMMETYKEEQIGEANTDSFGWRVTTIRKGVGETPIVREFTIADAKRAKLWGKAGPWSEYPTRMLLMRPRSWALRDAFPDVVKGIISYEEARDVRDAEYEVFPAQSSTERLAGIVTRHSETEVAPAEIPPPVATEKPAEQKPVKKESAKKEPAPKPKPEPPKEPEFEPEPAETGEVATDKDIAEAFEHFAKYYEYDKDAAIGVYARIKNLAVIPAGLDGCLFSDFKRIEDAIRIELGMPV